MAASDAEDAASPDPDFGDQDELSEVMAESVSALQSSTAVAVDRTESNSGSSDQHTPTNGTSGVNKLNPKDPSRPRRKKARRACFACQRAHLTCGDERPCQRCIKRGLQDQCHDGVRKKAKYLSDTPAELLNPPGMGGYHPYINGTKTASSNNDASGVPMTGSNETGHYATQQQPQTPTLEVYGQTSNQTQMPPPLSTTGSFGAQQSPLSPQQFTQHGQQHMNTTMAQASQGMTQFNGLHFDPSDPALFNFDIASLNFGNQYGALEFGMLNHMSSGANGDNQDMINSMHMQGFNQNYSDPALTFSQDAFVNADWNNSHPRASSTSGLLSTPNNTPIVSSIDRHDSLTQFPKAYAIGAGPPSMASASPAASSGVPDAPVEQPQSPALFLNTSQAPSSPIIQRQASSKQQPVQPPTSGETYNQTHQATAPATTTRKRPYDADIIYETVNKPYPYTSGFHRLFNYITRNFSSEKRIRVAKAVAAIRPSLITFSQGLTEQDLIFMERSVQRKLFEFHDFLQATGTPTIMARRDGAIVSASKEFSILTGWSKSVLLGKEPNLNINSGGASGASTAPGSAARTRLSSAERDTAERPTTTQSGNSALAAMNTNNTLPVLLAEILDQDTVVQFYEDFARLAFSSAGGSVLRRGRLLKYRVKSDQMPEQHSGNGQDDSAMKKRKRSQSIKHEDGQTHIKGEAGITKLGEREGAVDVMYCWTCRRDVFEVPTLIVMNFLPII
ncbi:uncharacterized protein PV09_04634 [Verruconis gallopava]|uniref:Zn(2)-C6 fungal-type domain-containing protein n=1 Tax=Verruconis gallopava TaxID=253628 RepID=A0A0D2AYV3_9PEZI|nr:uncharacterized protein PV09_04634 [Verruconis gallopava]KIW04344.1 hypothetical protein PV09_04634 [Verruconis gallopava]